MIITAIEAHLDSLRPSELAVARFVLGRPSVVVHMSIADIAESCDVSEPTIMRFCKALGCLGFMEFKLALARDLERRTFTMNRENPAVKGPSGFGQALYARVAEGFAADGDARGLDRIDEIMDYLGASRAITILHDGSEALLAQPLVATLLACRLEARAQSDLTLRGRHDGRVVLVLRSGAELAGFDDFCTKILAHEGKVVAFSTKGLSISGVIALRLPCPAKESDQIASQLTYLGLLETLRLGIEARLSRDGLFSDTAADMLQTQREIAYGDARRRDRQSAESQAHISPIIKRRDEETT
jgi:RpiR family transcriptional regulator, carbohydrate utilization regulator